MNIKNIEKIMNSDLWKIIEKDEEYRGYKIIDTHRAKPRPEGQFFVLLVFFRTEDNDKLKLYLNRGREIGSDGEGLDPSDIYSFYGTMKMVRFS